MPSRIRWPRSLAPVALALLAACGDDAAAPVAPRRLVRLCWGGDWLAIRNEGEAWTRVTRDPDGTASFLATERVAVARALFGSGAPSLVVEYVGAAQLQERQRYCQEDRRLPAGRVSATLAGLPADGYAEVGYGGRGSTHAVASDPTALLYAFEGANDLVALRWALPGNFADRAIVRRGQHYAADAAITLDFDGDEAFPLATSIVRWTSPRAHLQVSFRTAQDVLYGRGTGNRNFMHSETIGDDDASLPREMTIHSLPASRLAPGDMHQLLLGSDHRTLLLFFREPGDRSLALGPPARTPGFATLATAPRFRLRVDVPYQPEYGSTVSLFYLAASQPGMTSRPYVQLVMTREYLTATPTTWRVEVPDLRGLEGLPAEAGEWAGEHEWSLLVTSAPYGWEPEDATDGQQLRYANAYGSRRP